MNCFFFRVFCSLAKDAVDGGMKRRNQRFICSDLIYFLKMNKQGIVDLYV